MADDTNTPQEEINIEELIEDVYSFLGEPVYRNGELAIKDPITGKYFPVHTEIDSAQIPQIQDIKSKIHYL